MTQTTPETTFDPRALLAEAKIGVLATIKADGRPQLSPVTPAYDPEANVIRVSMTEGRAKTRNLRRDPRATLEVTSPDGWAWATVEGTATLIGPGTDPHGPEVEALVEATVQRFGRLDAAFNNAGVLPPTKPLVEMTEADWNRTIDVDLKGVWLCMKYEIPRMLAQGGGAIVNTASVAGVIADPGMAPYVAAKHGVVGLTRAAAIEYSSRGIRVNALAPGGVKTQMIAGWMADTEFTRELIVRHAIGRLAEPEEMAEAVLFLCSPGASFITGHVLLADGGLTAH